MQVPEEARRREGIRLPGARAVGSCELPDVAAGNQTYILCKNSRHSEQTYFSSPYFIYFLFQ